jgi:hypothetical protein
MVIATLGVRRGKIPNLILQGKRYEYLNDYGKLTKPIHLGQCKGHSLVGIGYYCFCEFRHGNIATLILEQKRLEYFHVDDL